MPQLFQEVPLLRLDLPLDLPYLFTNSAPLTDDLSDLRVRLQLLRFPLLDRTVALEVVLVGHLLPDEPKLLPLLVVLKLILLHLG